VRSDYKLTWKQTVAPARVPTPGEVNQTHPTAKLPWCSYSSTNAQAELSTPGQAMHPGVKCGQGSSSTPKQ